MIQGSDIFTQKNIWSILTVRKTKTFYDGQKGLDGEKRCALLHLFCDYSAAALRHDAVDFAQDIS